MAISIETPDASSVIAQHDVIVFGYPVCFSNAPKIVQDFITQNKDCFHGKKVFIIATMALCSGDITRNLFMNTKGVPSGLTAAFIDYIYSEEGAKIVAESGYIPIAKN